MPCICRWRWLGATVVNELAVGWNLEPNKSQTGQIRSPNFQLLPFHIKYPFYEDINPSQTLQKTCSTYGQTRCWTEMSKPLHGISQAIHQDHSDPPVKFFLNSTVVRDRDDQQGRFWSLRLFAMIEGTMKAWYSAMNMKEVRLSFTTTLKVSRPDFTDGAYCFKVLW